MCKTTRNLCSSCLYVPSRDSCRSSYPARASDFLHSPNPPHPPHLFPKDSFFPSIFPSLSPTFLSGPVPPSPARPVPLPSPSRPGTLPSPSVRVQGGLDQAIESLLALERVERLAEDSGGTTRVCTAILDLCASSNRWDLVNENISVLSKRRAQLKNAVQATVRFGMDLIAKTPSDAVRLALIETLMAVSMGKIYVEIERARLTRMLAAMKEREGDVAAAADLLQEVAVETFGAMHKREKIDYIEEQVRLCLDRGDTTRAQILAKKISPGAFKASAAAESAFGIEGTRIEAPLEGTPDLETLKLRYYDLMIRYHALTDDYLEIARCYRAIFDTGTFSESHRIQPPAH